MGDRRPVRERRLVPVAHLRRTRQTPHRPDRRAGGLPGQATVYRLITTILGPAAAPALDLAALYTRRWEIETSLDELKTHQGQPGMVLRSQTPAEAEQEIYGFLLVHYAIRSLTHHADIDPEQVSFTRTLRLVRRQVTTQAVSSPSQLTRALRRATREILRHLTTRRPGIGPG
ncbi:hypothetical protein [Dactylosporangium sp. CA-233914]|uniref:hypothetical protein n=1 Tax=Dactylosporangium sp. CA-233914 TaxID=3239934 RepID=UPI003D925897